MRWSGTRVGHWQASAVTRDVQMSHPQFPTVTQEIALNLIFGVVGECRFNRTLAEYVEIAKRLPQLKVLTFQVNELLKRIHKEYASDASDGKELPQICRFKAGDQRYGFEEYPKT